MKGYDIRLRPDFGGNEEKWGKKWCFHARLTCRTCLMKRKICLFFIYIIIPFTANRPFFLFQLRLREKWCATSRAFNVIDPPSSIFDPPSPPLQIKTKLTAFQIRCVWKHHFFLYLYIYKYIYLFHARADDAQVSCRWRGAERNLSARHEFVKFTWWGIIHVCCINASLSFTGAPVAVGMNIDIASIDMVSEVNMVGASPSLSRCQLSVPRWRGWEHLWTGFLL